MVLMTHTPPSEQDSMPKTRTGSKSQRRDRWAFVGLSAPAVIWFGLFMIVPLIFMIVISFFDWRGITSQATLAGLDNYERLVGDQRLQAAFRTTFTQIIVALPIVFSVAFMLAFFLIQRPPGYRVFRVLFFVPAMVSVAGVSMMFAGIFLPQGVVNSLLTAIGLEDLTRVWLGNLSTVKWAIIAIYLWGAIGFNTILLFASLSIVPKELYEMARIDGAGYWKRMWRIAFPLNLDFVGILVMLEYLFLLLGFAQVVILLTDGGPGNASVTLGYILFEKAFITRQLGYSQAIGVFILVIGMGGMIVIRMFTRRKYE